ncbi:LPXTG-motif protein cell wall anchor domain protein [Rothia aeria F0184]|jgi:protein containing glucan-binding domain|uniref:LPXTG-motif protein cell wall anchor domain protein n=1 Tax=Rothia aeria F0184 TaxID=888019 RepID=U7UYK7_9MICC|nr:excalibur calcium-binding domain-containing protein [Rothia aeria]ERT63984.1 LPXTG-motif protein cell wall anchor domain protein [Rothia aeria F0184]
MSIRTKFTTFSIVAALGCGMVGATVPAAFAAPGSVPAAAAHVYEDGASLQFPDTWTVGQPLHFTGTGFKATDGSPSILAIKINGGPVSGARYLEVKADADGNISGSIPWQENLKAGESVEINVLTGSLNKKDRQRGGVAATVTVVDNSAAPSDSSVPKDTPSETPSPSEKPSSVPSESPSAPAPSASSPVAAPSESPSESPAESPSATPSETAPSQQPSATSSETSSASTEVSEGATAEASPTPRFQNCKEVWDAGLAPIHKGHPDFQEKFDADHDGVGCEDKPDYENSASRVDSNGGVAASDSNNNSGGSISGRLASTGAAGVATIAGLGLAAVGAGVAAIVVMRRRKQNS